MKKEDFKNWPLEALRKKEKNDKGIVVLFVITLAVSIYFVMHDYLTEGRFNWFMALLGVVMIATSVPAFQRLKAIKEEMKRRQP